LWYPALSSELKSPNLYFLAFFPLQFSKVPFWCDALKQSNPFTAVPREFPRTRRCVSFNYRNEFMTCAGQHKGSVARGVHERDARGHGALKSDRHQFVARGLIKNAVAVWSGHLTLESTLETSKTRTGGGCASTKIKTRLSSSTFILRL
jgi:hypothetical protein